MERRCLWDCSIKNSDALVRLNWDQTHVSLIKIDVAQLIDSPWSLDGRGEWDIRLLSLYIYQHKMLTVKF